MSGVGAGVTSPRCSFFTAISSLTKVLYPNQAAPPKMISASSNAKSHFMDTIYQWCRQRISAPTIVRASARFRRDSTLLLAWEETVPEAANGRLFHVAPGEVAILTVKFLRQHFKGTKNPPQCRSHEFTGHLRILDV